MFCRVNWFEVLNKEWKPSLVDSQILPPLPFVSFFSTVNSFKRKYVPVAEEQTLPVTGYCRIVSERLPWGSRPCSPTSWGRGYTSVFLELQEPKAVTVETILSTMKWVVPWKAHACLQRQCQGSKVFPPLSCQSALGCQAVHVTAVGAAAVWSSVMAKSRTDTFLSEDQKLSCDWSQSCFCEWCEL